MWRLALALAVLLTAACSEAEKERIVEGLGHVEAVAGLAEVLAKSDTLIVSDVLSVEGAPSLTEYQCTPGTDTCTPENAPLLEPNLRLPELVTVTANPEVERSDVRQHNGIDVAEYSATETVGGVAWTTSHYGAWLDHSAFETTIARGMTRDDTSVLAAYNLSFGQHTGSAPSENATWTGAMLGHTRGQEAIHPLQGDATIGFDFDAMTVNVSFANVTNLETGAEHPGGEFSDIGVSDGGFESRTATAHIRGRFYGPAHEEVGGVFTYPTALGAFGARRP